MTKKLLQSKSGKVGSASLDDHFKKFQPKPSGKYKACNHHHELTDRHQIVNIGGDDFVANNDAIDLLKALNDAGLKTRTHHIDGEGAAFISIILDGVSLEIQTVREPQGNRPQFEGRHELLIRWERQQKKRNRP